MADQHHTAAPSRFESAAESAVLKLGARWSMVVVVPALLAGLGILGSEMWQQTKRTTEDTKKATDEIRADNAKTKETLIRLEATLVGLGKTQLPAILQMLTAQSLELGRRIDANEKRDDRQDLQIDELQRRVFPLAPSPPRVP